MMTGNNQVVRNFILNLYILYEKLNGLNSKAVPDSFRNPNSPTSVFILGVWDFGKLGFF